MTRAERWNERLEELVPDLRLGDLKGPTLAWNLK